jgi:hypothetical protein
MNKSRLGKVKTCSLVVREVKTPGLDPRTGSSLMVRVEHD